MNSLYCVVLVTCLSLTRAYQWDNTNCAANSFPSNITQYCIDNPRGMAPSIEDCSAYFDCSFQYEPDHVPRYFQQHMKTCDYPEYFDPESETCKPYNSVTCCDRIPTLAPCDYRQYKCKYIHCIPCDFQRPSCVGLSDGLHAVENRPNIYFQCQQQRTASAHVQSCPQNEEFDGRARQCSPVILS